MPEGLDWSTAGILKSMVVEWVTSKTIRASIQNGKGLERVYIQTAQGFIKRLSKVSIQTPSSSVPKWNRFHREVHPLHSIQFRVHLSGTGYIQASIQTFFLHPNGTGSIQASIQTFFLHPNGTGFIQIISGFHRIHPNSIQKFHPRNFHPKFHRTFPSKRNGFRKAPSVENELHPRNNSKKWNRFHPGFIQQPSNSNFHPSSSQNS